MEDSTIKERNKRKKEKKYVKCPNCATKFACKRTLGQKIRVKCPKCGKEGTVVFNTEKRGSIEKAKIYFPTKKIGLQIPEKITLRRTIWILFLFFLTVTVLSLFFVAAAGGISIEIFFVSIFIGLVLLKELTDDFTPDHLKKKLNILISGLLVIFLLIVINEIIYLIST
jgi:hypothetical protein